jgi:hypothetical protein
MLREDDIDEVSRRCVYVKDCAFNYHEKATVENDLGSLDGWTSTASTSYQVIITFHDNLDI